VPFVHEDADFSRLLRIVADDVGIGPALIEKDYWVAHTLWALHRSALDVWFKGGTSLSKGFGLIERFSEDLDLRIEPIEPRARRAPRRRRGPASRPAPPRHARGVLDRPGRRDRTVRPRRGTPACRRRR
jgi:hypothetical protein